jgi:hypothetical protein
MPIFLFWRFVNRFMLHSVFLKGIEGNRNAYLGILTHAGMGY